MEENLGLVHLCARRFAGKGLEYDDLFQAGCLGLVKAAENFDPERGLKFSTYAVPLILGEMRGLFRASGTVHLSRGMRELARRAGREAELLRRETGAAPSLTELAGRLGVSAEKAALALSAARPPLSLSADGDGQTLEIPVEAPEERLTDHLALCAALAGLDETERRLIECRYFQRRTQTETGKLLGMSQVQVSRREKKVLEKMRNAFDS